MGAAPSIAMRSTSTSQAVWNSLLLSAVSVQLNSGCSVTIPRAPIRCSVFSCLASIMGGLFGLRVTFWQILLLVASSVNQYRMDTVWSVAGSRFRTDAAVLQCPVDAIPLEGPSAK